jgi:hypothetical protein
MGPWASRYALSDSVFLTHADAETAVRQAGTLVFNLVNMTLTQDQPLFVRGAVASGEVKHVKGIFLESAKPANLVGQAVVDAVDLAEGAGLKGPRIFLSEPLARSFPAPLVSWVLRPTSSSGVWDVLWPLPSDPSEVPNCAMEIKNLCDKALALLRTYGGNPSYGAHYRELLLLLARCVERITRFEKRRALAIPPMAAFLISDEVSAACEAISGLPEDYVATLVRLVKPLEQS